MIMTIIHKYFINLTKKKYQRHISAFAYFIPTYFLPSLKFSKFHDLKDS